MSFLDFILQGRPPYSIPLKPSAMNKKEEKNVMRFLQLNLSLKRSERLEHELDRTKEWYRIKLKFLIGRFRMDPLSAQRCDGPLRSSSSNFSDGASMMKLIRTVFALSVLFGVLSVHSVQADEDFRTGPYL